MIKVQHQYILFYKPFGVLSQFTKNSDKEQKTIADFGPFPKNVYPVGRLDADSEGLVLLTDDGRLKHYLLEPRYGHPRTYLVQVERIPTVEALDELGKGVLIEGRNTLPAKVELLDHEPDLPPRSVPIRFRKNVPTAWLKLTLREGRNRQVRKMTASVGFPTLRLVRVSIGPLGIAGLEPGKYRELTVKEVNQLEQLVQLSLKD